MKLYLVEFFVSDVLVRDGVYAPSEKEAIQRIMNYHSIPEPEWELNNIRLLESEEDFLKMVIIRPLNGE